MAEATRSAWYEHSNDITARFEQSFAAYTRRAHAVTLPSCTAAIHLSLAAMRIGPGDEVIVPDLTWIATSAPISYLGATPLFADVDPITWCLDPDSVAALLGPRTRAVIAVDLYGGMPAFDRLAALCDAHGVALIEDAAEAIGSRYLGAPAGSFGVTSVFSFHGSKTLTTGEGGMLGTNDTSLFERTVVLRDHGRQPGEPAFYNREVAFKYKMSAMQAALGQAQLDRVDELVAMKRRLFSWYVERLGDRDDLTLNAEPSGTVNSYWMTTIVLDPSVRLDKVELANALAGAGIATRPVFYPLSSLPAYAESSDAARARATNTVSRSLGHSGLNLPSALSLTEEDVDYVCRQLCGVLDGPRAAVRPGGSATLLGTP
ncbi:MAG: DegT/DnrJ/EryC1/StrS family aminotransferase [Actinomycetota bacterium]|nr:DegT/DnrJ/EryC1/StrS family aminotransferase [Actinomycetota bacterium]